MECAASDADDQSRMTHQLPRQAAVRQAYPGHGACKMRWQPCCAEAAEHEWMAWIQTAWQGVFMGCRAPVLWKRHRERIATFLSRPIVHISEICPRAVILP